MKGKKPGFYSISVVAKTFNIHPQTLRMYEREGLLKPSRTDGNTRLYSRGDIEQLESILSLTRELGVNLAGVDIILKMRQQMDLMKQDIQELLIAFRQVMMENLEDGETKYKNSLVRVVPKTKIIRFDEESDKARE